VKMSRVAPHSPRCDAEFELEADAKAFMKACSEHGIAVEMYTRIVYRVARSEAPVQPALPKDAQ